MLFNSYIFWVFFLVVMVLYRIFPHRAQNRLLLVASYVFYGWWDWRFLSLIALSTVVDYFTALGIVRATSEGRRRTFLVVSMVTNLGLLGVFKYYDFFAAEFDALLTWAGLPISLPFIHVLLPVGISFYTFQTMSYTIDVYRGVTKPTTDFLDFALYVSFFPQLVAGPIERSSQLLPQILEKRERTADNFQIGLYHIIFGLLKKVVIADNMAAIANDVFGRDPSTLTGVECLVGVYAFAFQIYGDFSGYSSIAQGVARMMGFKLMDNFRMPYFAISPSDFWRRWHISLSTWLRDYLYISLGGNRGGRWKTYRNLMLTMVLGGLWHGAGWTFIIWGAFHGFILCVFRFFGGAHGHSSEHSMGLPIRLLRILLMFHLVCFGWLFFRAETVSQAGVMLQQIVTAFTVTEYAVSCVALIAFYVLPLLVYEIWVERGDDLLRLTRAPWVARSMVYSYCALMLLFFPPPVPSVFIYFQF